MNKALKNLHLRSSTLSVDSSKEEGECFKYHYGHLVLLEANELMEVHQECMTWKTLAFGTMVLLAQNAGIEFMSIDSGNLEQGILLKYLVMNFYCKGCLCGYWHLRGISFINEGQEEVSQGKKLYQKCEDEILEYEKVCNAMNKRVPNLSQVCFLPPAMPFNSTPLNAYVEGGSDDDDDNDV